jgi:hypothetical protein
MKILIAGSTGFVGTHLTKFLLEKGFEITGVSRSADHPRIRHPAYRHVAGDTSRQGSWQDWVSRSDAIVNLAGRSIFGIWTEKTKKDIHDSRILTTRHIVDAIPPDAAHMTLCSTSAVGYYGDRGDQTLTETDPPGSGFLAEVGKAWESAALEAQKKGVRVVIVRFGVILGKGGGAIEKMLPVFRACLGGPIGDGNQWFPWIHLDDSVAGISFLMENPSCTGAFNFTAPNPVINRKFAKTLASVLGRPAFMPVPAFMVRTFLGEFGNVFLSSHRAVPEKLISAGYPFKFPQLSEALKEIVSGQ